MSSLKEERAAKIWTYLKCIILRHSARCCDLPLRITRLASCWVPESGWLLPWAKHAPQRVESMTPNEITRGGTTLTLSEACSKKGNNPDAKKTNSCSELDYQKVQEEYWYFAKNQIIRLQCLLMDSCRKGGIETLCQSFADICTVGNVGVFREGWKGLQVDKGKEPLSILPKRKLYLPTLWLTRMIVRVYRHSFHNALISNPKWCSYSSENLVVCWGWRGFPDPSLNSVVEYVMYTVQNIGFQNFALIIVTNQYSM